MGIRWEHFTCYIWSLSKYNQNWGNFWYLETRCMQDVRGYLKHCNNYGVLEKKMYGKNNYFDWTIMDLILQYLIGWNDWLDVEILENVTKKGKSEIWTVNFKIKWDVKAHLDVILIYTHFNELMYPLCMRHQFGTLTSWSFIKYNWCILSTLTHQVILLWKSNSSVDAVVVMVMTRFCNGIWNFTFQLKVLNLHMST